MILIPQRLKTRGKFNKNSANQALLYMFVYSISCMFHFNLQDHSINCCIFRLLSGKPVVDSQPPPKLKLCLVCYIVFIIII